MLQQPHNTHHDNRRSANLESLTTFLDKLRIAWLEREHETKTTMKFDCTFISWRRTYQTTCDEVNAARHCIIVPSSTLAARIRTQSDATPSLAKTIRSHLLSTSARHCSHLGHNHYDIAVLCPGPDKFVISSGYSF